MSDDHPDLFDICANNHGGVHTSVSANLSVAEVKGALRKKVLAYIKSQSNATCEEIETALGMKHQTASARVSELLRDGFIYDTGQTRPTSSGRPARVLKA